MNANRIALRAATTGPCNPSPVHSSPKPVVSKRPSARGGRPSALVFNPRRAK
ncbi:MAG: hypothetical protein ACRD0G_18610 [Acidimicrobiales bacterium]